METYPDIVRRDGTLFFACADNDRAAISTSIERLIDLLDALDGDPDLEPYLADTQGVGGVGSADDREGDDADLEPSCGWSASEAAYGIYDGPVSGEEEEEEPSGFGDVEGMHEDMSGEPSLGWTNHIDQTKAHMTHNVWFVEDGEHDLATCGNGTGWQKGEPLEESEDEREWDPSEAGIADADALHDFETTSQMTAAQAGLIFDGSGFEQAEAMIRAGHLCRAEQALH